MKITYFMCEECNFSIAGSDAATECPYCKKAMQVRVTEIPQECINLFYLGRSCGKTNMNREWSNHMIGGVVDMVKKKSKDYNLSERFHVLANVSLRVVPGMDLTLHYTSGDISGKLLKRTNDSLCCLQDKGQVHFAFLDNPNFTGFSLSEEDTDILLTLIEEDRERDKVEKQEREVEAEKSKQEELLMKQDPLYRQIDNKYFLRESVINQYSVRRKSNLFLSKEVPLSPEVDLKCYSRADVERFRQQKVKEEYLRLLDEQFRNEK